ncbi:nitroreductase family deazaflavin-dependent oxidoreductase [Kribbella jejuensis]|uniref:Deazaflavin-dependent oxidoreductase (Nitroreductase family) n=1 Tax=Kribbella jejuensis TaxID=236068 RepID=A0A542EAL8_9ACTN|nr:nitroreductase family deazaflavin-dependent oxidoreductase [Kribbella jejuensis]TQJ12373.1 deazaflavin-dependent oxidoreductase (nitroreductase family) [Kribbella jejuensis]
MSFDTQAGTHGAWQPRGRALQWMNGLVKLLLRRSRRGKVGGFDMLVLRTIGRKSGTERQTPVSWIPAPDGSRLIIASAWGGQGNPDWYYNLAANPDQVRIDVDGGTVDVRAEQLHGAERDEAWQQIVATAPRFAEYQQKTDRELPVIRLVEQR